LKFDFGLLDVHCKNELGKDTSKVVTDGVLVHGLFLENARWDLDKLKLVESFPN